MAERIGAIDPTQEQLDVFKGLPRNEPIHMLNLIRLREKALYPPEHPNAGRGISGLEAYRSYARGATPTFQRVGGRQIWLGDPQCLVIGPAGERWDLAFIAEYPSAAAFLQMITDGEYREQVKHRQAAVADSRLIRLRPRKLGVEVGPADH
ncbi:MAG TPA: DUF1330 domain-containing protein [Steroidobacteraceae bacterium]|nr:DUF1330 domain-containing protein [Steroidobacteraceae bacterium]